MQLENTPIVIIFGFLFSIDDILCQMKKSAEKQCCNCLDSIIKKFCLQLTTRILVCFLGLTVSDRFIFFCQWQLCCSCNQIDGSTLGLKVTWVIPRKYDNPKDNGSAATAQCSPFLKGNKALLHRRRGYCSGTLHLLVFTSHFMLELVQKENNKA